MGIHACKVSELSMARKFIHSTGDLTIVIILNQCSVYLYSKYLSSYAQINKTLFFTKNVYTHTNTHKIYWICGIIEDLGGAFMVEGVMNIM